ncbi:predicted protein [Plenodomus lingam JN3]|uniref:Predicted protein n=1 Tax=Leptosphaeria maculans (strain JN3 / isolate v23.1.3 / race Av1-4-5-6-7-8) TaxID=985895 RepID=E4ZN04_LEPMJ|nr:predicted protein [Plenodomus lingam JN3]CBX92607.1 predicted protein [Plenodomus lingam JN3]
MRLDGFFAISVFGRFSFCSDGVSSTGSLASEAMVFIAIARALVDSAVMVITYSAAWCFPTWVLHLRRSSSVWLDCTIPMDYTISSLD